MQFLHIETAFTNFPINKGCLRIKNYRLKTSLSAFAGKNFTFWEAAICICSPVLGFLPTLAFLLATLYVPKPAIFTESSFFNASKIVLVIVSKVRSASALLWFSLSDSFATSCSCSFLAPVLGYLHFFIKSLIFQAFFLCLLR